MSALDKIIFVPYLERDTARVNDVYNFRDEFSELKRRQIPNTSASVLEVLVCLSRKIDRDILYDSEKGDRSSTWFWMLMQNTHLLDLTDDVYKQYPQDAEYRIRRWAEEWMYRKYSEYNTGLFIFRKPVKNLNKLDLWSQTNKYIMSELMEEIA